MKRQGVLVMAFKYTEEQLKPYEYFKHLLTEIPKHMEDNNTDFLAELLPWSEALPEHIRKAKKLDDK